MDLVVVEMNHGVGLMSTGTLFVALAVRNTAMLKSVERESLIRID